MRLLSVLKYSIGLKCLMCFVLQTAGNEMLKKYYNVIQTCRDIFSQPVSFELYKDTSKSRVGPPYDILNIWIGKVVLCLRKRLAYIFLEFVFVSGSTSPILMVCFVLGPVYRCLYNVLNKKQVTN